MPNLPASRPYESRLHGTDDLSQLRGKRTPSIWVSLWKVYGPFSEEVLTDESHAILIGWLLLTCAPFLFELRLTFVFSFSFRSYQISELVALVCVFTSFEWIWWDCYLRTWINMTIVRYLHFIWWFRYSWWHSIYIMVCIGICAVAFLRMTALDLSKYGDYRCFFLIKNYKHPRSFMQFF